MKELIQDDFVAILVRDLGQVVRGKNKYRFAEFICTSCQVLFSKYASRAKASKTGTCTKCSSRIRATKHGGARTPLYKVWSSMVRRCHNNKDKSYKYYGDKGVTVCDEWRDNFSAFRDWANANYWEKGKFHIDKDLLSEKLGISPARYSPETCLLISPKENVHIQVRGRDLPFYVYLVNPEAKKPFQVRVRVPTKKLKYCGSFTTVKEAVTQRDTFMKENSVVYG